MPVTDDLLINNEGYAADFSDGGLAMPPSKNVAIVACMDARLMVSDVLGIGNGEEEGHHLSCLHAARRRLQ